MAHLECPNCGHGIDIMARLAGPREISADRARIPTWTRPFMAYLRRLEPRRYSIAELSSGFRQWAQTQTGINVIPTDRTLGKVLDSWGYERYRVASGRGFVIDGPRRLDGDEETGALRVVRPEEDQ
jgi:hypothetical protein